MVPNLRRRRELGVEVTAIASGRIRYDNGASLSDPDPEARDSAISRLEALIHLAADLDSHYVILGGVLGNEPGKGPLPSEELEDILSEQLSGSLIPLCRQLGVCLLLEPINRYERTGLNTASSMLRLLDRIGDKSSLGLLLDTYHMNIEESDPIAAIIAAGDWLRYLHIADSNRLVPGMGHIDFAHLLQSVAATGFDGPVAVEALPFPDDEYALTAASYWWESVRGEAGVELASHAR